MKHGDADSYVNAFPELRKWIRVCPLCGAKGYDPEMPDSVGGSLDPRYAARYIKGSLNPLEVDDMGICLVCAKYINKK